MAIALVASSSAAAASGGANLSGVASMDSSGANFIVVAISDFAGVSASTISDSKGNTPSYLSAQTTSVSGGRIRLAYFVNPTVGAGHTFSTGNAGTAFPAIAVLAFSGVAASSPYDATTGESGDGHGPGGGSTITPGSLTPSQANEVVVTGENANIDTSNTINASFSAVVQAGSVSGGSFYVAISYLIQTTAAAANPTWTGTDDTQGRAARMACFKSSGASARPGSLAAIGVG